MAFKLRTSGIGQCFLESVCGGYGFGVISLIILTYDVVLVMC